jgi:hypothetical protein
MNEVWNLIIILIIILFSLLLSLFIGQRLKLSIFRTLLIFSWHTLFTYIYAIYVINYGGDAVYYYESSKQNYNEIEDNLFGVIPLVSLIYNLFGLSFLGVSIIFGTFGIIGLLFFSSVIHTATFDKNIWIKKFGDLFIFLPSVSFWSSGIGKDSLSFLSVNLALWSALHFKKRFIYLILSILLMFTVRPHIAGIMVVALLFTVIIDNKLYFMKKIIMIIISIIVTYLIIPFALNYSGVNFLNLSDISNYIEIRQGYNMDGVGGIDISELNFIEKLFTYMFRPSIFEINSFLTFAAGIDNLFLLFLFILGVWAMLKHRSTSINENFSFLWAYTLMTWILLAITTANLGISLRQKWMFAPILIYLFISAIASKKNN